MTETSYKFPDYDNPPVIEVVCGIHFKPINEFLAPHLGLLWEKFRSDYPICQEVAPLSPVIERFGGDQRFGLEIHDVPPLPRIWFVHKKDTGIIQIQRDRFLHNWRKMRPEDEYPRYPNVIKMFIDRLSQFKKFLIVNEFEDLEPLQFEMTYINHIWQGEAWTNLKEVGKVFPDFNLRYDKKRFLPEPESINWRTSFVLPQEEGRLNATIRNGKHRETGQPMISLDLTVRGIGEDKTKEGMLTWFDLARKWIVLGFEDLTGSEIQEKIWGKRN